MPELVEVGPAAQLNDFRCCDKFDVMEKVSEIKLPVLCIVGDQDNMTPPKYSQYLAGKTAGLQDEHYRGRHTSGLPGKAGGG